MKNVTQSLKSSQQQIVVAYDTISEHGSGPQCAESLEAFGGGKLCLKLPYPEDASKPAEVEIVNTYAARIISDSKDFGKWLFNEWLEKSLADKTYAPSPAIERVEGVIPALHWISTGRFKREEAGH